MGVDDGHVEGYGVGHRMVDEVGDSDDEGDSDDDDVGMQEEVVVAMLIVMAREVWQSWGFRVVLFQGHPMSWTTFVSRPRMSLG